MHACCMHGRGPAWLRLRCTACSHSAAHLAASPRRPQYTYLEHFKLALHEGSARQLPDDLTAVQVVADYLGLMRRCAW